MLIMFMMKRKEKKGKEKKKREKKQTVMRRNEKRSLDKEDQISTEEKRIVNATKCKEMKR